MPLDYDLKEKSEAVKEAYNRCKKTSQEIVAGVSRMEQEARSTGRISEARITQISEAHTRFIVAANDAQFAIVSLANTWFEGKPDNQSQHDDRS